jgi:ABC-type sulfate/molybdate transport systems ATPase subunit
VPDLIIRELRVEREGRVVLDGCSADFPSGRRTVLWGRSGTGKSTLLAAIAGLLVPRSGAIVLGSRVFFSSADGIDLPPYDRRIGFVFQDLALWPHLSAIDHACLVGRPSGLDRVGAQELLESVGLAGLERRRPGQLSGGEQQRLAIARALAGRPSVLLLDEPFSSVDRRTKDSLYALVRQASSRVPGPTIYVTHHVDDAVNLAERVMTLDAGRLARSERPWEGE